MAKLRHEEQQYTNAAALVTETLVPTANDVVYVEDIRKAFRWVAGATGANDNLYIIDQTTETANGRWLASNVSEAFTGTANTNLLDNGQLETIDITVTGAAIGKAHLPVITNGNAIPANVFITDLQIVAANTVRAVVENQSGVQAAVFAINVTVIGF